MVVLFDQSKKNTLASAPKPEQRLLSHIHVIPIASGKGGVGKSTVTLYTALALRDHGFKVGILDGDIYGPSLPTLLNIAQKPELATDKPPYRLYPIEKFGLKVMSVGFFTCDHEKNESKALIWRGPMAQKAFMQLVSDTDWTDTEILLVDMPPGTGDIQLTLMQRLALTGALIVSTPQKVALEDAKKSIKAFEVLHVPILGIVENMTQIFGQNYLIPWAQAHGYSTLGSIPFDPILTRACDEANPTLLTDAPMIQEAFDHVARGLIPTLKKKGEHF